MIQLKSLTERQRFLLNQIQELEKASNQELLRRALTQVDHLSRVTIIRDLAVLLKRGFIKKTGKGRGLRYVSAAPGLLRLFDSQHYFQEDADRRKIQKKPLEFSKKSIFEQIFSSSELRKIDELTKDYHHRLKIRNKIYLQKEFERMTIEFSWKSSRIEGNTYSLLDTELLLQHQEEAKGKTHEEALMILNHKAALQYANIYKKSFKRITLRNIQEVHALIVKGLNIKGGLRNHAVGVTGTQYKPYDNQYQIRENLEHLCALVNSLQHPFLKSFVMVAGLSYVQPFEDGNKRTSRLLGNALLLAYKYCPLSYRSVDEALYKKAMILFYEQHSLMFFKELFENQYCFAVKNYFL